MRYKAVMLDFYGTLVEEDGLIIDRIVRRIAAHSPVSNDPGQIIRSWRFSELCSSSHAENFQTQRALELQSLEALLQEYHANLDAGELSDELFTYWRRPAAYSQATAFLAAMKMPQCIVSNIDNDDLSSAITHNGWSFDTVVTSEGCRAYKPRPEPFRSALKLLGLKPGEVLHVGDSLAYDVRGAQEVGIDVAWVNRKQRTLPSHLPAPNYTVTHVGELAELLQ